METTRQRVGHGERVRVGVIGCGSIAQIMHLPYLKELDDRFAVARGRRGRAPAPSP